DAGRWTDRALPLAAAALAVLLVMSLGPKKQDRYLLPATPLLGVVAAVGFERALRRLPRPSGRALAVGGVGAAQLALCAWARPYYFTFYSPLFGGAVVAEQVLPVGWGEGLDLVAAYLEQRPNRSQLRV